MSTKTWAWIFVYNSINLNSQRVETTQTNTNWEWINKTIHIINGILFGHKRSTDASYNMDKPWKHTQWNKRHKIPCMIPFMGNVWNNPIHRDEDKLWVAKVCKAGREVDIDMYMVEVMKLFSNWWWLHISLNTYKTSKFYTWNLKRDWTQGAVPLSYVPSTLFWDSSLLSWG